MRKIVRTIRLKIYEVHMYNPISKEVDKTTISAMNDAELKKLVKRMNKKLLSYEVTSTIVNCYEMDLGVFLQNAKCVSAEEELEG